MKLKASSAGSSPFLKLTAILTEAFIVNVSSLDEAASSSLVKEGLKIADEFGLHLIDFLIISQEGFGRMIRGDKGFPINYLTQFEQAYVPNQGVLDGLYSDIVALHYLHAGNLQLALVHAINSLKISIEFGMFFQLGTSAILLAQVYFDLGEVDLAWDYFSQAEERLIRFKSPYWFFSCDMLKAYMHLESGDEADALPPLRRAFSCARQHGYLFIPPYVSRKTVVCRLFYKALEEGIETPYLVSSANQYAFYFDNPPMDLESWPWPIKIHTLGRFSLLIDGNAVSVSGKLQKKPLQLLKVLVAYGGRDICEDQLADILWPEADGDAGHNALTTTLARLRKLLGHDQAVKLANGRLTLNNRICWVDRWAFERLCSQVDESLDRGTAGKTGLSELKAKADKAVKFYNGPFLSRDSDQPWTIPARERLQSRFQRLVGRTARIYAETGDIESSVMYYRKGLEAEPLSEELHQGLISAFIRSNRFAEALAAFAQCRKILQSHSVPISEKTESLRRQIHKK
jgi:DNA-binding SARP family transcriptional activator